MTTATKSKGKKTETETVTKDGVLSRNNFIIVVSIASGINTLEDVMLVLHRAGTAFHAANGVTHAAARSLVKAGLIAIANAKPRIRAELSLTDAGWDALAKTRAFYATEKF